MVETRSLSGVPYPALLPEHAPSASVRRALEKGILSNEGNYDPIWSAVQQNDKYNAGLLVADDVGIGKSRTAAGFVLDRIERGRKRILVMTDSQQNLENLMNREFPGVWGGSADENGNFRHIPADFPAERVWVNGKNFPEAKKGAADLPTYEGPAVYFVDKNNFAQFTGPLERLNFEVVIVDEVDSFKNLETNRGKAWGQLHTYWLERRGAAKVDFMYLSATPAIDVADLQYLYGLKVWKPDGFEDWLDVITDKASPEAVAAREAGRAAVDGAAYKIKTQIQALSPVWNTQRIYVDGRQLYDLEGYTLADRFFVVASPSAKGYYDVIHLPSKRTVARVISHEEAILTTGFLLPHPDPVFASADLSRPVVAQARLDYGAEYGLKLTPEQQAELGPLDSSDIMAASGSKTWGAKSNAFTSTLPPAHTEQIMRELKVSGAYMSRDISRAGVEFNVREYTPGPDEIARFDRRVSLYERIVTAFNKWGKFDQGPKKNAAVFGVFGDLQGDAKRTLFDIRLKGTMEEVDAALARGEKVVISVVSVSETDAESGFLANALSKINTNKVERIKGTQDFTTPEEIPEALIEVMELRDDLAGFSPLQSPVDILRERYGDRLRVITGDVSVKERQRAVQEFQSGLIDVVMISGAGKRGISLHDIAGDLTAAGQPRRVHLIVGDYEWSASTFKQELGRVDRTGQKSSPKVTLMHTGSAAEKKFVATISNRMKGLGAASKGGAEATGTSTMTDMFEMGNATDRLALSITWGRLPREERNFFLDKYFRDQNNPEVPRGSLPATSESVKKFLLGLQSVPRDVGQRVYDAFEDLRRQVQASAAGQFEAAEATARSQGEVLRQVQLGPNLVLNQVQAPDGEVYGLLEGVLTPVMARVKGLITGETPELHNIRALLSASGLSGASADEMAAIGTQSENAWMRWQQVITADGEYHTGLRLKKSAIEKITREFGLSGMSAGHTPETALVDLRAGDRIKLYGANTAEWELYLGKAGNRDGRIVVDGAKMKDRDALMRNGAVYITAGNFFAVPEDKLADFLARFPIRNEAAGVDAAGVGAVDKLAAAGMGGGVGGTVDLPNGNKGTIVEVTDRGIIVQDNVTGAKRSFPRAQGGSGLEIPPDMARRMGVSDLIPTASASTEGWWNSVKPILAELRTRAEADAARPALRGYDYLPPEMADELQGWMRQTAGRMAESKLAAVKWGEFKRDASLLNYSRRYMFNNYAGLVWPYEFFMTHSMLKWALHSLQSPGQLAAYYRINKFLHTQVQKPGFPTRLAGRVKLPIPFLKDAKWMGGGLWVDPLNIGLPFNSVVYPFEQLQRETRTVEGRAQRKLQELLEGGSITQADYDAAITERAGPAWDRAMQLSRSEEDTLDGLDFASLLVSPHLPIGWAINAAKGDSDKIGPLPLTRHIKAITAMLGIGPAGGVNLEGGLRRHLGLPVFDQFEDYRVDRTLSDLAAEGAIDTQQSLALMIERDGPMFEWAQRRAAMQSGFGTLTGMVLGTPGQLYPEGENRQRVLGVLFGAAMDAQDNGNTSALEDFFDTYPEFETRLSLNDNKEERLSNFLVDQVWTGWRALPDLYRWQVEEEFGSTFTAAFLEEETRAYNTIPPETLAGWARTLGRYVPYNQEGDPLPIEWAPAAVASQVQEFNDMKGRLAGPRIMALQRAYFAIDEEARVNVAPAEILSLNEAFYQLPKGTGARSDFLDQYPQLKAYWDSDAPLTRSERSIFLGKHPELTDWWDTRRAWLDAHPAAAPYLDNSSDEDAQAQVTAPRAGVTGSPEMQRVVSAYLFGGQPLSEGARALLAQTYQAEGQAGDTFDQWLLEVMAYGGNLEPFNTNQFHAPQAYPGGPP